MKLCVCFLELKYAIPSVHTRDTFILLEISPLYNRRQKGCQIISEEYETKTHIAQAFCLYLIA